MHDPAVAVDGHAYEYAQLRRGATTGVAWAISHDTAEKLEAPQAELFAKHRSKN